MVGTCTWTTCFLLFSDVLAAYARFLWETEEDEDEEDKDETLGNHNGAPLLQGVVAANA